MAEYIEKVELIKKLCFETAEWCYSPTIKTIKEFPVADVQPVRHGRWIRTDKSMGVKTVYACSECGYLVRESDRTNYCGDCGSKLDIVYQDDKVTATKVTGW